MTTRRDWQEPRSECMLDKTTSFFLVLGCVQTERSSSVKDAMTKKHVKNKIQVESAPKNRSGREEVFCEILREHLASTQ